MTGHHPHSNLFRNANGLPFHLWCNQKTNCCSCSRIYYSYFLTSYSTQTTLGSTEITTTIFTAYTETDKAAISSSIDGLTRGYSATFAVPADATTAVGAYQSLAQMASVTVPAGPTSGDGSNSEIHSGLSSVSQYPSSLGVSGGSGSDSSQSSSRALAASASASPTSSGVGGSQNKAASHSSMSWVGWVGLLVLASCGGLMVWL